jgi:hypothetical protein
MTTCCRPAFARTGSGASFAASAPGRGRERGRDPNTESYSHCTRRRRNSTASFRTGPPSLNSSPSRTSPTRYHNALGEAREVVATFDVAVGLGYVAPFDAGVARRFDRIIGTLMARRADRRELRQLSPLP